MVESLTWQAFLRVSGDNSSTTPLAAKSIVWSRYPSKLGGVRDSNVARCFLSIGGERNIVTPLVTEGKSQLGVDPHCCNCVPGKRVRLPTYESLLQRPPRPEAKGVSNGCL